MTLINLSFLTSRFPDVKINGQIFESKDPILLSEDLLEVSLPTGRTIDVGWYPEHDSAGAYRVASIVATPAIP